MAIIQRPTALGLMLCDQVSFDKDTLKPSLIGVFNGMAVEGFPSPRQKCDLFAALTDGIGEGEVDLVVIHSETEEQIHAQSLLMSFPEPLKIVNFRFRYRELVFPRAGEYRFAFLVNGEEIAQRRIRVYELEEDQ